MGTTETLEAPEMTIEVTKEHHWLQKFVGEWTFEGEATMGPDGPPMTWAGTASVRPIGDVWVLAEWQGEVPGGGVGTSITTLGYDPQKKRFVQTFIGSMMTSLWVSEGTLDADERVLTLDGEGPDMMDESKTATYRDVIEFETDDHRILTSYVLGDDGKWNHFMTAHYRRRV